MLKIIKKDILRANNMEGTFQLVELPDILSAKQIFLISTTEEGKIIKIEAIELDNPVIISFNNTKYVEYYVEGMKCFIPLSMMVATEQEISAGNTCWLSIYVVKK